MDKSVEAYKSLVSQRGWIDVRANRKIWIPCPAAFPKGMSKESWARICARVWWERRDPRPEDLLVSEQTFLAIYGTLYTDLSCQLAWLHLPDPRMMPLPLRAGIWESRGYAEDQLRLLTNADDHTAIDPPKVSEFYTEDLGTGIKTMRYLRLDDSAIMGAVNYAWRSERFNTDVRLFAASDDLGRLEEAIGDIEDFARSMQIVERRDWSPKLRY